MQVRLLLNLGQRDAGRFGLAVGHGDRADVTPEAGAELVRLGWAVAVPAAPEARTPEPADQEPAGDGPDTPGVVETPARIDLATVPPRPQPSHQPHGKRRRR